MQIQELKLFIIGIPFLLMILCLQIAVSYLNSFKTNSDLSLLVLGNHFYSGGAENVLVKWFCEDTATRHYLPRLPANIVHLSVTEDNQYVSVSTRDNGKTISIFISRFVYKKIFISNIS